MEDIAGEVEKKIGNIIASDIETYLRKKKEIIDIFDAFLGTLSERDRIFFCKAILVHGFYQKG